MREWLLGLWYTLNRKTDMSTLWPICKETAPSLEVAQQAFYLHCMLDDAWNSVMDPSELEAFCRRLT